MQPSVENLVRNYIEQGDFSIDPKDQFYPFEAVAEAYEKGKNDLQKEIDSENDFKDIFDEKIKETTSQAVEVILEVMGLFTANDIALDKFYLNLSFNELTAAFTIDEDSIYTKSFKEKVQPSITEFEIKLKKDQKINASILFVELNSDTNFDLLNQDFILGYDFKTKMKL